MRQDQEIPQAHGFSVDFCGECPNAHILLYDATGRPFAQMILSAAQCRKLEAQIRQHDPNFKEAEL